MIKKFLIASIIITILTISSYTYSVVFFDDFSGTVLNPAWEEYIPYDSPIYGLTGTGYYQVTLPNINFDHWSLADRAPQLRLNVPNLDWDMETHLLYTYNGGTSFQPGLMVYFSQYDILYWGPYANIDFRVERSGISDILHAGTAQSESYLRIVRSANRYNFYYKTSSGSPWIFAGSYNSSDIPTKVGLITKTWYGHPYTFTASYDYFRLNVVPEPISFLLFSLGLTAMGLNIHRRKS